MNTEKLDCAAILLLLLFVHTLLFLLLQFFFFAFFRSFFSVSNNCETFFLQLYFANKNEIIISVMNSKLWVVKLYQRIKILSQIERLKKLFIFEKSKFIVGAKKKKLMLKKYINNNDIKRMRVTRMRSSNYIVKTIENLFHFIFCNYYIAGAFIIVIKIYVL